MRCQRGPSGHPADKGNALLQCQGPAKPMLVTGPEKATVKSFPKGGAGELPFIVTAWFQEQVKIIPFPSSLPPCLPSNSWQMKESLQMQGNATFSFVALGS